LATVLSGHVIFVATDHVASAPPVAFTNSGSSNREANSSALLIPKTFWTFGREYSRLRM
jgi:hypothetical protein